MLPTRKPKRHAVFDEGYYAEADEDLSWWSTSTRMGLEAQPVRVEAKKTTGSVQAFVDLQWESTPRGTGEAQTFRRSSGALYSK